MTTLRVFLSRLGSPDAISWVTVVAVFLFHTSGSIITSGIDFSGQFFLFLLVRFVGLIAFFGVLGFGKLALMRWAKSKPQPLITLGAFFGAMTAGTWVFDALLVVTGLADQSYFVRRMILTVFAILVVMIMVALVVTTAREYGNTNTALASALQQVRRSAEDMEHEITQRATMLAEEIRQLVSNHVSALSSATQDTSASMRALIDDVIRPLSHDLATSRTGLPDSREPETSPTIPWRLVVTGAMAKNPFSLLVFPLALGIISAAFLIVTFRLPGLIATAAVVALSLAINAVSGVLWRGVAVALPTWAQISLFSLWVTGPALVSVWAIRLFTGFDLAEPTRLVSWFVVVGFTWWFSTLSVSLFRQLRQVNKDLTRALRLGRRRMIALNSSLRHMQKGIARALHGPVQQAVASSLARLDSQPDLALDPDFLEEVRSKIDHSLGALHTASRPSLSLRDVFTDMTEVWEGVADVSIETTDDVLGHLSAFPATSQTIAELAQEAVSNAIRHGEARKISVTLGVVSERNGAVATLTVTNDGEPVPASPTPGLGSHLFDELTLWWSLESGGDLVTLMADIPLVDGAIETGNGQPTP